MVQMEPHIWGFLNIYKTAFQLLVFPLEGKTVSIALVLFRH